ncbi:hypothetical protein M378DRAFT_181993 [Amanita muscaria Koide BX008]|uniref:Uncharacterized protein n=1 Tax=Amanita muscaria (strain Koide BX008) TaxID=946122 RepID=A0A0C2WI65_AMAMK|nr:hypothetical protein M378DRAFT_181993 [Amanita muscaria Koide BX008]
MPKTVAQRSWWWDHYEDNPSFKSGQGATEGYAGAPSGGKHKIYCPRSRLTNSESFRSMVEQQSQLVDDDDTDCTSVRLSTIGLTPIKSLFDFSRSHWIEMYSKSSIRSFDEELQLYEMLDLDAEGEDDADVDVDDDTGDILMVVWTEDYRNATFFAMLYAYIGRLGYWDRWLCSGQVTQKSSHDQVITEG